MNIDEMKKQLLSNLAAAILDYDNRCRTENRISTPNDADAVDFEGDDTLMVYLPYKLGGHRMLGRLKLTVELEK